MRILRLQAQNVKKLKAIDIEPPPNAVELSGANEQGKTSAIDAIAMTLSGDKTLRDTPQPIRKGEERAESLVHLGDPVYDENGNEVECKPNLKATRVWTTKGTYLKLENADGAQFKTPQAILDKLIGNLTFDPLAFSNMKEKEQLETLLGLVQIPIDLGEWAEERKRVYDERTLVNRQIADLESQVKGTAVGDEVPEKEVSIASVMAERDEAQTILDANNHKRSELDSIGNQIARYESDAQFLKDKIESLEEELLDAKARLNEVNSFLMKSNDQYDSLSTECNSLIDPDLTIFRQKITEVEETNRRVRLKKENVALRKKLSETKKKSESATVRLAGLDEQRESALKAAVMPIDGLSFNDNGVTYREIPFKQCSSEERLHVSVAMGMALNPKLRVMFIRDASLLDSKNREVIKQMAKDNQYQLWLEIADDSGKVGLVFEDGEIVNAPKPKAEKPTKKKTAENAELTF